MRPTTPIVSFTGEHRFLSNFWICSIVYEGHRYASVEHAYQGAKCRDRSKRIRFRAEITAGQAKRLGRKVDLREDWESVRLSIMLDLLRLKFASSRELRNQLLETAPRDLIEGNTWGDRFWGQSPVGVGENHLGRLLMQVRTESM